MAKFIIVAPPWANDTIRRIGEMDNVQILDYAPGCDWVLTFGWMAAGDVKIRVF